MASALIYCAPVAKKTREHNLLGGAKSNTEKFGPLKVVLKKIAELLADRTVCLHSRARLEQPFDTNLRELLLWRTGLQSSSHA